MKQSMVQATTEAKRRRQVRRGDEKSREEQLLEKEGVTYQIGGLSLFRFFLVSIFPSINFSGLGFVNKVFIV